MKLVITDPHKVSQFSNILKNLKNFSIDIEFHINNERLYAQGMDSSHVCLFELVLLCDWFTEYEVDETSVIGINCELLSRVLNCLGENQNIELNYNSDNDNLFITLSPKEGESGIVKEFKLPLMNLEVDLLEKKHPQLYFDAALMLLHK